MLRIWKTLALGWLVVAMPAQAVITEPIDYETLYTIEFTVGATRSIPVMDDWGRAVLAILLCSIGVVAARRYRVRDA